MQSKLPVSLGDDVFYDLLVYLQQDRPDRVLLVADQNTFSASGRQVEESIRKAGPEYKKFILTGQPPVVADENSLVQVMHALDGQEQLLIAVGSGTITDIVRYVSYQARLPFLSVPTAASVDAYTSYTTAVTIGQVKYSVPAKTASAVFAHLPTLCSAPKQMTAAGFGDMVAKYTGLADWQLGHLLAGDAIDEQVVQQARQALSACIAHADEVGRASPAGISALIASLLTSGLCMVAVKSSRPAAGSEHSLAHFWEIKHRLHHLPESLHGEKTGVATALISRLYEKLRRLSRQEMIRRLENYHLPDLDQEHDQIRQAYGDVADLVMTGRASFLGSLRQKVERVKKNLLTHWDDVQAIAALVPGENEIISLLKRAGSLHKAEEIQVGDEEVAQAIRYGMYIRDRFTILELNQMLNLQKD